MGYNKTKVFKYTNAKEVETNVVAILRCEMDEEGDDIVMEIDMVTPIPFSDQPYAKEDVLASIHGLGIRLYDDFKFNF